MRSRSFMKRRIQSATIALVLAATGVALTGASAQVAATSSGVATAANGSLSNAERAANLYGRELIGSDNQKLGKIENVIVDLESEHILYVVVGTGRGKVAMPPQIVGQTTGNTLH